MDDNKITYPRSHYPREPLLHCPYQRHVFPVLNISLFSPGNRTYSECNLREVARAWTDDVPWQETVL